MISFFKKLLGDALGILLFLLFIGLFLFSENLNGFTVFTKIPGSFLNVNTIFLSIVLEAIPFILLGVFVSAIIQAFVSENSIKKLIPRNALLAVIPAALLGIIFPICECAIVPVVRRLIKKGMPVHAGIVFMLSAPIVNPVVYASTYFAFRSTPDMANERIAAGFCSSIVIGLLVYLFFNRGSILKENKGHHQHSHTHNHGNKFLETLYHASDELFDTCKYLFIGAFFSSLFQTFLNRNILLSVGSNHHLAPAVMMLFAYVLSVCSTADSFVASSFASTFTKGAILAFLVFGPMIDIKNTLMLFAYFKKGFVIMLLVLSPIVVYVVVQLFQFLAGGAI